MKKNQSLKSILLKEETEDIFKFITEPDTQFTDQHRQKFLEEVKNFNKLAQSVYREISLKEITHKIKTIGKVAERMIMTETDDWFDQISLKRDAKALNDSVNLFEKTAKEIHHLQNRLESSFQDIGTKLDKYFQIDDTEEDIMIKEKTTKFKDQVWNDEIYDIFKNLTSKERKLIQKKLKMTDNYLFGISFDELAPKDKLNVYQAMKSMKKV